MVWYGMVWYGMVWYGMVWYGMVWYGMVCNISNKIFFLVNDLKYVKMKKLKNEMNV
jgi:hypothetical protein